MGLSEDLERIALQERELRVPRLDAGVAWELGSRIRTMALERGLTLVVDVRRFGQPLFYAALDGTSPDNPEWVRRKSNVVARFHRSSYGVGITQKMKGTTLQERQGLQGLAGSAGRLVREEDRTEAIGNEQVRVQVRRDLKQRP